MTLGVLTIIRVFAAAHVGLAPDETYYWLWAQTPDFGYSDHPPMIAWWIWLSTRLLGDTALGIRMLPILSTLVTSAAVYGISRQLFSADSIGLRAVLWFNAMILVGVGAIFSTPDAPSTLFWALALWALAALWRTGRSSLWLSVGLLAGLGCVSKYTNFFLGLGIAAWLLIDPVGRRWLLSPWLWAGGFVAIVLFLPVFLWNAEHGWISFSKQFGRLAAHEITLRYFAEFVLSQVGLLNPLIAFFVALGAATTWNRRSEGSRDPYRLLLATMGPLLVYMLFHAFHDRVQANWLAPVYPQIAILAANYVHQRRLPRFRARLARAVVPVGVGISTAILLYLTAPVRLPLLTPNPADRLEGWRDLAAAVEEIRRRSGARWIATVDYDINAELAFYERGKASVQEIVERERYSFSSPDPLANRQAILVLSLRQKASGRFDRCFLVIEPISTMLRSGPSGPIESYVVELVWGAAPDIFSRGCSDVG